MKTLTSDQSHGAILFLVMRDTKDWSELASLTASRKVNSTTGMLRSLALFIFESIPFTLSVQCTSNVISCENYWFYNIDDIPFVLIMAAILSVMRKPTDPPSFLISPSISSFERPRFESRTNLMPSNVRGRWEDDSGLDTNEKDQILLLRINNLSF